MDRRSFVALIALLAFPYMISVVDLIRYDVSPSGNSKWQEIVVGMNRMIRMG